MNERQRILLVVALGLAIAVVAATWNAMVATDGPGGGWLDCASATCSTDAPGDAFRAGAIWFVAVLVWTALGFRLLRSRRADSPEP